MALPRFENWVITASAVCMTISTFHILIIDAFKPLHYNGKHFGEKCEKFNDCGESPKSFIACLDNVCKCHEIHYFDSEQNMCVSYVGGKCDPIEPEDGLPQLKCGKFAQCRPKLKQHFGLCHCIKGYAKTEDNLCQLDLSFSDNSTSHINQIGSGGVASKSKDNVIHSGRGLSLKNLTNSEKVSKNITTPAPISFPQSANSQSGLESSIIVVILMFYLCSITGCRLYA